MALQLNKEVDSGAFAQYHKIESVIIRIENVSGPKTTVDVHICSYHSKEARDANKDPMGHTMVSLPDSVISLTGAYELLKVSGYEGSVDV